MCQNFFTADNQLREEISLLLQITSSIIQENDSDEEQESITDEPKTVATFNKPTHRRKLTATGSVNLQASVNLQGSVNLQSSLLNQTVSRPNINDQIMSTPNTVPRIIETLEKYQFEMWNEYHQHHSLDNSILLNEYITTKL